MSARNFKGTNEQQGWMGVKFQAHPRDEASQITIHVRMLDNENLLQQEALGIVGVNLLYGAFFLSHEPELLVESLLDGFSTKRIEIDMIEFSGIEFRHVDNRLMSLKLVQLGLSKAAMFSAKGEVLQPSEAFYKRQVLIERGSFRPVCTVNIDMMSSALERLQEESSLDGGEDILEVMEITMSNLVDPEKKSIDHRDFLARADVLTACGKTVLISNYFQYYRLAAYLSRYTKGKIAITLGIASLVELFDEKYYTELEGGILESFGRLFKNDLQLLVYPLQDQATGKLTTVQNLEVAPGLRQLYHHLVERGSIVQLDNYDPACLPVFSRDVLRKIKSGDTSWEAMVPAPVAEVIKKRCFFGYCREAE